jgi:hypothetical protein
MEKQKKIYCGSGKKKSDTWLQVTVNPEKFAEYVQEFNGNKFIKLNINLKSEPDKYGKDVEITIDTWKPDASKSFQPKTESYTNNNQQVNNKPDFDDLPF